MSGSKTPAVIDRIVDGKAVLLVGDDEVEYAVDVSNLPPGAREGSWLRLSPGPPLMIHELDPEAESQQRHRIKVRMERLRRRADKRFKRAPD